MRIGLAILLALLILPARAHASVSIALSDSGALTIVGDNGSNAVGMGNGGNGIVVVTGDHGITENQDNCAPFNATRVDCGLGTGHSLTSVQATFGTGNDQIGGFGVVTWTMDAGMGAGNDIVAAGRADDVVSGGPGQDSVSYGGCLCPGGISVNLASNGFESVSGSPNNDTLTGTDDANLISGGGGVDVIDGHGGNDTLSGAGTLQGGDGNDDITVSPARFDQPKIPLAGVDGGTGNDTVKINALTTGGPVDGGPGADALILSGNPDVHLAISFNGLADDGSDGEGLNVIGIESAAIGGSPPSTLTGDAGVNNLGGGDGDDVIDGGAGSDVLAGARGNDRLLAADGVADTVVCGDGDDTAVVDFADMLVAGDCEHVERASAAISAGPPDLTNRPSATFEFALAGGNPPPGHLECSLDGGGFATCTSPRTVTVNADGRHSFRVRFAPDGSAPGAPAERLWTLDTHPPALTIDAAPSGDANPGDVTVEFHADEPAAFTCAVDSGPDGACASPLRLTGLAPGRHQLDLVAVDAAGNASATQGLTWGVAANPPATTLACPPGTDQKVTFGLLVAVATSTDSCFFPAPGNGGARQSPGPVLVNGVLLTPAVGEFVVLDSVAGGGRLQTTGPYTIGLGSASFEMHTPLTLDGLASLGSQVALRNLKILTSDLPKLFDFPLRGEIKWEFATADGGSSKLTVAVALPSIFHPLPDGGIGPPPPASVGPASRFGSLTVTLIANASNTLGVTFAGKAKVSELWLFGKVKLKDVEIAVDLGKRTFSASAGVELAESGGVNKTSAIGRDAVLTVTMELGPDGIFDTPLRKLTLAASQLEKAIGDGVYLQRIGGELAAGLDPLGRRAVVLTSTGGASLGPRLRFPPFFEGEAVSMDGTMKLMIPVDSPPSVTFQAEGIGKIVDVPVSDQEIAYTAPGRIEYHGNIDATLGGFGLFGAIRSSWFDAAGLDFNVEAALGFRLPGLLGGNREAEGVFSKTGFAACSTKGDERFGFGRRWGQDLQVFEDACDIGPFRSQAVAAQAGPQSFRVARGTRVLAVAADGAGAPPKVTLRGPGGVTIATPAGPEGADGPRALVVQDPATATTWFILHHPAAGRWTASARVRVADGLPPVRVHARVHRGTLSWRAFGLRGQSLTLAELSAAGARVLARTTRAHGHVKLPRHGPAGTRRIVATVTHRGLPRLTRTVARYRAPGPPALRRVTALRRRGALLRWRAQPAADAYALTLRLPDGSTLNRVVERARLKLPPAARRGTLHVTITAMADGLRHGPVSAVALRAAAKPRHR